MSKALETKKEYLDKIEAIKADRNAYIDGKVEEYAKGLQKQLDEYALKLDKECDYGNQEIAKLEEVVKALDEVIALEEKAEDKLHSILEQPEEAVQMGPIVVEPIEEVKEEPIVAPIEHEVLIAEEPVQEEPVIEPIEESAPIVEEPKAEEVLPEPEIEEKKEEKVLSRPGMKIIFKR